MFTPGQSDSSNISSSHHEYLSVFIAQLWGIVGWGAVIKYVSRMIGEN